MSTDMPAAGLVIELGRYPVGEAGIYVTRVSRPQGIAGPVFLVEDGA
ncbi:MAG: hypothetical protein IPI44_17785 [Sulfuritalea sp.]|nr:hypothetical protein [Sulfuritalea sp.]